MSIDLFKMAQNYLSDELLSKASSYLGEDMNATKSGFAAVLPTLMAGMISKGSDSNGAKDLFNLVSKPELSGNLLNNLGGLFGGASDNATSEIGNSALNMIFGDKLGGVANVLSRVAGLKSGSGSTLLKLAAPFLMSIIGKQVKGSGLGLGTFVDLLMGQKDNVKKYAPAGLLDGLGSSLNLGSLGNVAGNASKAAANAAGQGGGLLKKLLPFLVVGLLALLGFYFMRGCNKAGAVVEDGKATMEQVADSLKNAVSSAANTVADATASIYNVGEDLVGKTVAGFESLGAFMKLKLGSGIELIIPENGVESKLIKFAGSTDAVSKDLWFDFDRILFETGSATLKAESMGQLKNIAEILKAYPKVHLKIGGYTDNTGNAASNMSLSKARAEAVKANIVSQGIQASRLEAEGYGDQHPVASNDTEEGRAKNRRVAARVTQK